MKQFWENGTQRTMIKHKRRLRNMFSGKKCLMLCAGKEILISIIIIRMYEVLHIRYLVAMRN